jgi:OmpA-OmpF porin, OOP family
MTIYAPFRSLLTAMLLLLTASGIAQVDAATGPVVPIAPATDSVATKQEKNYNLWSVNLNLGTHVGIRPYTDGYHSTTPNYFKNPNLQHVDINVRKMFNTKFGLALDISYDRFTADAGSPDFDNNFFRTSLRGVMNMHRVMNWEEFTDTFGMQLHVGTGFSYLEAPSTDGLFGQYDNIFSILGGTTLLVRLNHKFMMSVDFTVISNLTHHVTLDGQSQVPPDGSRTGVIYTNTLGLTYYFGKKEKHADWYYEDKEETELALANELEALEARLAEQQQNNAVLINNLSDKIDQLEGDLAQQTTIINNFNSEQGEQQMSNAQMKTMLNSEYVNVYFDFDKTKITTGSISAINFLIKYLNANPQAHVDIIGYADEYGTPEYNINLSRRRAERVYEMITRFGIDPKRMHLVYRGADASVPKESALARQLVRRVAFEVYDPKEREGKPQPTDMPDLIVFFDRNSSYLNENDKLQLRDFADVVNADENAKVWINCFTDATGTEEYNQWLMERRLSRVVEFLKLRRFDINKLNESVLQTESNSGCEASAGGCTEEDFKLMRRCELFRNKR